MTDPVTLKAKWDDRYRIGSESPMPARVLAENAHLLPIRGRALDLACGLGGSALFLARAGLTVDAWDLSTVAIDRLSATALSEGLELRAEVRDVLALPLPSGVYDVIVVSHFLERSLAPALRSALVPGGLLFYQTFVRDAVGIHGPANPEYRLAGNELLELFEGMVVRVYREEWRVGDLSRGFRDLAQLVAQRL